MKETKLHDININEKRIDLELSGEPAKNFMKLLINFFKQNGGENYLAMTFEYGENKYSINIENCNGEKSIAEEMKKIKDKNTDMHQALEEIVNIYEETTEGIMPDAIDDALDEIYGLAIQYVRPYKNRE